MNEKACQGGRVLEYFDFAECAYCGTRIRWDLQNHPFFGFQSCVELPQAVDAVDPHVADPGTLTPREKENL